MKGLMNKDPNEDFVTWVETVVPYVRAIVSLIALIEQSENKDEIELFIQSIQENYDILLGTGYRDIKQCIRNGEGDFSQIQQKCIDMGVV